MSKTKGSLYEVLKSASRAPGETPPPAAAPSSVPAPEGEAGMSLQERLAAYKARKLAEANTPSEPPTIQERAPEPAPAPAAVAVRPEPPPAPPVAASVTTVVAPPPAAPVETSAPAPAVEDTPSSAPAGPGEKVVRLTYNTVAFACLVGVGLVFIAYALGLQAGKNRAAAPVAAVRPSPPPAAQPAPPRPPTQAPAPVAPKEYAVRLAEWKYGTARERLTADAAIADLKRVLDRQNVRNVERVVIQRGGEIRAALYVDRWRDIASPEARARLAALQKIKAGTQAPFAQAAFEEVPK